MNLHMLQNVVVDDTLRKSVMASLRRSYGYGLETEGTDCVRRKPNYYDRNNRFHPFCTQWWLNFLRNSGYMRSYDHRRTHQCSDPNLCYASTNEEHARRFPH